MGQRGRWPSHPAPTLSLPKGLGPLHTGPGIYRVTASMLNRLRFLAALGMGRGATGLHTGSTLSMSKGLWPLYTRLGLTKKRG